jgi:hypothetical protein
VTWTAKIARETLRRLRLQPACVCRSPAPQLLQPVSSWRQLPPVPGCARAHGHHVHVPSGLQAKTECDFRVWHAFRTLILHSPSRHFNTVFAVYILSPFFFMFFMLLPFPFWQLHMTQTKKIKTAWPHSGRGLHQVHIGSLVVMLHWASPT